MAKPRYWLSPEDEAGEEFQAVLIWLAAQGAPPIRNVRRDKLHIPGRADLDSETVQVVFHKSGFDDFEAEGGLILRSPEITLTELETHFKFGDPKVRKHFRYRPEKSEPLGGPTPLPEPPTDPVGPLLPGTTNRWFVKPGMERTVHGTLWQAPEVDSLRGLRKGDVLRLIRQPPPFGSTYWERV